ncbi:MAG TPA: hypothetical protein VFN67_23135 [Polyangiales bacterium]|nr:hypothetical protein [Polyangiales bacterium]
MSLITQCMPEFSLRFVQRVAVDADCELAYLRLRGLDLSEIPLVHSYFRVKSMPKRVRAWWRGKRRPLPDSARLTDLVCRIPGVNLLGEQRRDEIVFGVIGKFWQPTRPLERVAPQAFRRFSEPGFGKLALSLRVAPRERGGTWISVELRGHATDALAEANMKRAWFVIGRIAEVLCRECLQRLAADLGPLVEDESLRLPGDALLQDALFQTTHALTLEVPPQRVWSWLMQKSRQDQQGDEPAIGQHMPGLAGEIGDFVVVRAESQRLLVLGSASLLAERVSHPPDEFGWSTTWAFVLAPIGDDATRLFVRVRSSRDDKLSLGLLEPLMAALHDALERRHLDTLCRQAEGWAA